MALVAPHPAAVSAAPPSLRQRHHAPFWLNVAAFAIGLTVTLISMGLQLRVFTPLPFWQQALGPSDLPLWFAAFFSLSVVLSLWIITLLADSAAVRRVAFSAFLLATYLAIAFAITGLNLRLPGVPAMSAITESAPLAMFYLTLAECAEGSLVWTALQLALYTVMAGIVGAYDPRVRAGGGPQFATELYTTQWELAVFVLYFIFSGFFRWGALYACQQRQASDALERWWYRILIFIHLGLFWSVFAVPQISRTFNLETAILYHFIVTENMLLTFTPLALVCFMTLSRSRTRELQMALAEADRRRAEAEAAATAKREYLG